MFHVDWIGDERPCTRCIKRGLQNSCHDGTRKKAKYLHDAPNDALLPATLTIGAFPDLNGPGAAMTVTTPVAEATPGGPNPQTYYTLDQSISPQTYQAYPQNGMAQALPLSSSNLNTSQQSPNTPGFPSADSQQSATLSMYSGGLPQLSPVRQPQPQNGLGGPMFDAGEPAVFNFDIASMNFGNHYGALEFGMLGHMSSGAMQSPTMEETGAIGQSRTGGTGLPPGSIAPPRFSPSGNAASYMFASTPIMTEWQGTAAPIPDTTDTTNGRTNGSIAHGYTIGTGTSMVSDLGDDSREFGTAFAVGSSRPDFYPDNLDRNGLVQGSQQPHPLQRSGSITDSSGLASRAGAGGSLARDASSIYDSVTEPYSYTAGFHALTAYLQRRFSPQKTLRIAKALASIRPSFISCTKTLNQEDLIFMEKCFQRTLWEYENFINAYATPTIVCRRTGEVAAVGNEFTILTGWRKEVLLGKEGNLNVNTGSLSTGNHIGGSGSSSRGYNTPRVTMESTKRGEGSGGSNRAQPVFLAELLDDDSVIKFYEDFAKLAFEDSRGSVTTRCKLLKYKIRKDPTYSQSGDEQLDKALVMEDNDGDGGKTPTGPRYDDGSSSSRIASEGSIHQLESQDGTVECICCWTVRRDVFEIPMLIVMNVSFDSFDFSRSWFRSSKGLRRVLE